MFRHVFLVGLLSVEVSDAQALAGYVRTPEGQPIPNATVTARKRDADGRIVLDARSGRRGDYRFPELLDGVWEVESVAEGRLSVRYMPIYVQYPYPRELNIVLPVAVGPGDEPPVMVEALLVGRLVNRRGEAVGRAEVCVVTLAPTMSKRCRFTNGLGQYSLPVPFGLHEVTVRVEGRAVFTRDLVIETPGIVWDPIQNPITSEGR